MLNPVRTEASAFHLAVGSATIAGVAVLVAFLTRPLYGGIALAAGAAAALVFLLVARNPERARPLRDAAASPHPGAPVAAHRILVIANDALAGPELRREIMSRVELWPELLVVAPVLSSRLHFWASDFDRDSRDARARLEATLAWAAAQGFTAQGEVGDPEDPLAAVEDALRWFGADEVIVATHPPEQANWLEAGVLARLHDELDVPMTHVVAGRGPRLVALEHETAGAGSARGAPHQ